MYERAAPAFAEWQRGMCEAFLRGYRQGLGDARASLAPDNAEPLLKLFQIARALHELIGELTYRPAAIGIPVEALLRLMNE